jgi:CheY-like chemotaxis protein
MRLWQRARRAARLRDAGGVDEPKGGAAGIFFSTTSHDSRMIHVTDRMHAAGGVGAHAGRPSMGVTGLGPPGTEAGGTTTGLPAGSAGGRPPVTVVVIDDSKVFRRGMVRAIQDCADLRLVGEADGGHAGLDAIERLRPDVAVLDLRMPDLDGIGVLERLRDDGARTRVVLVSATLDDDVRRTVLALGAAACLSKAHSRADICTAAVSLARQ